MLASEDFAPAAPRPTLVSRLDEALDRHPVLRLFPEPLRSIVRRDGQVRNCSPGASVQGAPVVGFMLTGVLAVFDKQNLASVGLLPPGSTFGWEAALKPSNHPHRLLALLESEWIEMPVNSVQAAVDAEWLEHFFTRHALGRIEQLQADAACNAVHPVPVRVANLILRLCLASGIDIRATQASLAEALGVQRTSVNAAIKFFERAGALVTRRGRVQIIDTDKLHRFACGCGQSLSKVEPAA